VIICTDDESLIERYVRALRENPYGVRFWGTITGITVNRNTSGALNGDYRF
jgi:hypothetical protein